VCTVRVVWRLVDDDAGAADRLLADEVADVLGCSPDEVRVERHCPRCGATEHGRPIVLTDAVGSPPHVSLARAPGIVVVAVSTDHSVGVDIERIDQTWPTGTADLLLHEDERAHDAAALTTLWVRKESLLKANGDGLRVEPSGLRLTDPVELPRLLQWTNGPGVPAAMQDLEIDGYAACVTVLESRTVRVTQRQAASGSGGRGVSSSQAAKRSRRS
jgi:4'-phosphopantetheinyl transferase